MTEATTERAIGRLEGKLDAFIRAVDDNKTESARGRERIYGELESLRHDGAKSRQEIAASKEKIEEVADKMEAAEVTLSEIKRWKERMIGMGMAFGLLGFSVAAALQLAWKWVAAKFGF